MAQKPWNSRFDSCFSDHMTKREKIKLLLRLNKASFDFVNMSRPELMPDALKDDPFMIEFRAFYLSKIKEKEPELIEAQIDIYDNNISEEALDAAIQYYQTPGGAEFASKTNQINLALAELSATVSNDIIEAFHMNGVKNSIASTLSDIARNNEIGITPQEEQEFARRHKLDH